MNVHLFFSKYIYEQKVLSFYLVIFFSLSLSPLSLSLSLASLLPSTPLSVHSAARFILPSFPSSNFPRCDEN